jgi:hypothetical protein
LLLVFIFRPHRISSALVGHRKAHPSSRPQAERAKRAAAG